MLIKFEEENITSLRAKAITQLYEHDKYIDS